MVLTSRFLSKLGVASRLAAAQRLNLTPSSSQLQRQPYRWASSFYRSTEPLLEKITMKVPSMGDSITEGTIVEWTVDIGQAVKEGDVLALVETDKVTVDIKAETTGVLVAQYGEIDENVEVGANLCQIDTEGVATAEAAPAGESVAATEATVDKPAPVPVTVEAHVPPKQEETQTTARSPSIQFLGKEGWALRLSPQHETESPVGLNGTASVVTVEYLPVMYGRPQFSEEEMEALMMGGANQAPEVQIHSGGAVFK